MSPVVELDGLGVRFGKHQILTEEEVDLVTEFIYSL